LSFLDKSGRPKVINASEIVEVPLLIDLEKIYDLILSTSEFFFKEILKLKNPPFRGFLLEGPPGTGKTEIVKQMARKLDQRLDSVHFCLVDGASIAAPKWGEAERNLRDAFHRIDELQSEQRNAKMVVLFDDIESLMISRGANLAKEWHYAINSILFHELDALNPNNLLIYATTNRPDLVDDAIRTRLYPVVVPPVSLDALKPVVEEILDASEIEEAVKDKALSEVMGRLRDMDNPTIREARSTTVVVCIEEGIWRV
jgi:SpoVK/Ycf46/Vps4 family AAA+-type ATPase